MTPNNDARATRRRYVAIDLETTGVNVLTAQPLEIAAVELNTDPATADDAPFLDTLRFVPHTDRSVINDADPDALAVNRWYERRMYRDMLDAAATVHALDELVTMLDGATLVGANVAYDAAVLWPWLALRTNLERAPWHFRLYDVELATAVALSLDAIPSLSGSMAAWELRPPAAEIAHTALGDAMAAGDVFHAIRADAAERAS